MIEQRDMGRIGGNCEEAALVGTLNSLHICIGHFQGCGMCLPYSVKFLKFREQLGLKLYSS